MLVKEDGVATPVGQMPRLVEGEPERVFLKLLVYTDLDRPDLAEVFCVGKRLHHRRFPATAVTLLHDGRVRTLPRFALTRLTAISLTSTTLLEGFGVAE